MSGNFFLGYNIPEHSQAAKHTTEVTQLRTNLDSLNISNPVVVVKHELESPSSSPDYVNPVIIDIAEWPHLQNFFSCSYESPPIFRDPSYQQAPFFIKTLEGYFQYHNIPNSQQLALAKSLFRGPSVNWRDFHESKWNCYEDFRRHFLTTFWSESQQIKEKERLSHKKYTETNKSQLGMYFMRSLDKYRFFTPQLEEHVILEEVMAKFPPNIQNEWSGRRYRNLLSALSFLQAKDTVNNNDRHVSPESIQTMRGQMNNLDLDSDGEVNDPSKGSADNSNNQQSAPGDSNNSQHATFVFDNQLSPPVYLAGQNPTRFIKNLQDYFTFAKVPEQEQLNVVKSSLVGILKDWMNRHEYKWTCMDDFYQDFLTSFWSKERQSCEWLQLEMQKFVIGRCSLSDFFAFMVNRYRLFHPLLSEERMLKETMCKYPVEIQSLWAASGCTTLKTTHVFLERQDEVGILNVIGKSDSRGGKPINFSSVFTHSEKVKNLDHQMRTLSLEDQLAALNNPVKTENDSEYPAKNYARQLQSAITIKLNVSPPIFQDKNTQNAAQFIKKLLEYFSLAQVSDEDRLNVAKSLLRGNVTEWRDFYEVYWTSYSDFRQDFIASFWSEHKQAQARKKLNQARFTYGRKNDTMTRYFLNQVRSYRLFEPCLSDLEILKEIMGHFPDDVQSAWRAECRRLTLDNAFLFLEQREEKKHLPDPHQTLEEISVLPEGWPLPARRHRDDEEPHIYYSKSYMNKMRYHRKYCRMYR